MVWRGTLLRIGDSWCNKEVSWGRGSPAAEGLTLSLLLLLGLVARRLSPLGGYGDRKVHHPTASLSCQELSLTEWASSTMPALIMKVE